MKKLIPNSLTLANLASGLVAIILIFQQEYLLASFCVGASLLFDFLDGLVARALGVHSEMGLQLDSLADVVSFGVVPGFFMYQLYIESSKIGEPLPSFMPFLALVIPLFSALRLAKFNIDTRQTEHFIGLPTPANALMIFGIGLWALEFAQSTIREVLLHPFLLTFITLGSSLLLVAEIPMMSLKVKSLSWTENKARYILLMAIAIMLFVLRFRALAFIIPLYLVFSLVFKPKENF